MFAIRLRKNRKRLRRWIRSEGVSCYRIYDADMPECAVAVDVYEIKWAHEQEYAPPPRVEPKTAQRRLQEFLTVVPEVLEIDPADVFLKIRRRQRGHRQHLRRQLKAISGLGEKKPGPQRHRPGPSPAGAGRLSGLAAPTDGQVRYDLCRSPTFSNSKDRKRVFEVQRDHVELIDLALKHMECDGTLLFSCNFRKFKLDEASLSHLRVEPLTEITRPPGFSHRQPHQCWKITFG